jgi:hypothetical protein
MTIITRAYNNWEVDNFRGALKKISENGKLKDEIAYYKMIPEQYRVFFPRLLDSNASEGWMLLERYDYPNLGECMTNPGYDMNWEEIFAQLLDIIREWRTYRNEPGYDQDAYKMYISKTARENRKFKEQNVHPDLFVHDNLIINDAVYRSFEVIWPEVKTYIQSKLIPSYRLSFIHGDFGLGNILWGPGLWGYPGSLRFVDPRGSFGSKGHLGDIRYDVAKLYHSVDGGYDFFNGNLFYVKQKDINSWEYKVSDKSLERVRAHDAFTRTFFRDFSKKDIILIEGLIFVGACARHYENSDRQLAMYLTGIELLNEAMKL